MGAGHAEIRRLSPRCPPKVTHVNLLRIDVLGGLYVTSDGQPLTGVAGQPRRLALLSLLAVAGDRGVTRSTLLAYLWPDCDEEHGGRALTQALYDLRRDLGSDEAFLGMKDLRLNSDVVASSGWATMNAPSEIAPPRESDVGPRWVVRVVGVVVGAIILLSGFLVWRALRSALRGQP